MARKNKSAKKQHADVNCNYSGAAKPASLKQVKQPQPKGSQPNSSMAKQAIWCGDCETMVPRQHVCAATCMRCNNRFALKDVPRHDCIAITCCGCCQGNVTQHERPTLAARISAAQTPAAVPDENPVPPRPTPKPRAPNSNKVWKKKKARKNKHKHRSIEE
ncbi:uncharacterized protein N7483_008950 [Penicillium malachiteum]|uniref:uncharacterized protein n=1 Tax=Penicillium malachiteum TaxID=1324776 RepID=UPI002546E536|nr:uncharacterized protein N7483_008950 [Penicillium malachiteum]KAJ5721016.1 hypothetical protein N7483_008950 [Penicillium malachiteum]